MHGRGERMHDVLDPDDRDPAGPDRADDPDQLGHLGIGQPAGDLIEQQQPRAGGQRPGDLEPLAREQAEPLGRAVGVGAEAGQLDDVRRGRVAGLAPQARALLGGHEHVLEHGHRAERLGYLEGPSDAEAAPGGRVQPGDRLAGEPDLARRRCQVARDEAEQAALARAVRPDDADHVAGTDGERQVVRDHDPAEALGQAVELQQGRPRGFRHSLARASPRPGPRCSASCRRPSSRTGTCLTTSSTGRRPGRRCRRRAPGRWRSSAAPHMPE